MKPFEHRMRRAFHEARPRPQEMESGAEPPAPTPGRVAAGRPPAGFGASPGAVGAHRRGQGLRGGGPAGSRNAGANQPDHQPVVPGAGIQEDDPVPARVERGGDPVRPCMSY